MPRTRKKDVSLMALDDPKYLSLVGSPANRTGFKVIRSEGEEDQLVSINKTPRVRKTTKRSDSPLLSIKFPAGATEEDVSEAVDMFDLGSEYQLVEDDGHYVLRRTDEYDGTTVEIELSGGLVATMAHEGVSVATRNDKKIPGVTLVRMDFSESQFSGVDSVKEWLTRYDIDFEPGNVETVDGGVIVTRHDANKAKSLDIAPGVTGYVIRSEENDVPIRIYRNVIEQSYGNWGWGHLDFAASLADPEFTDKSWDAIWSLRDVLENIVLYSGLPLEERKTLVHNATESFTTYITGLMDALPTGAVPEARSDRTTSKETDMAKQKEGKVDATRSDDADKKDLDQSKDAGTEDVVETQRDDKEQEEDNVDSDQQPVTRGELTDLIAKGVAAALAQCDDGQAKDSESGDDATAKRSDENAAKEDPMAVMAEAMASVAKSVEALRTDVENLKDGETVVRDDADDSEQEEGSTQRSDVNPASFDGMFGDRFHGIHS